MVKVHIEHVDQRSRQNGHFPQPQVLTNKLHCPLVTVPTSWHKLFNILMSLKIRCTILSIRNIGNVYPINFSSKCWSKLKHFEYQSKYVRYKIKDRPIVSGHQVLPGEMVSATWWDLWSFLLTHAILQALPQHPGIHLPISCTINLTADLFSFAPTVLWFEVKLLKKSFPYSINIPPMYTEWRSNFLRYH